MPADIWGNHAVSAMNAARSCYQQIPDTYRGKSHLGLSIEGLDHLVARVVALHDRLEDLSRSSHG